MMAAQRRRAARSVSLQGGVSLIELMIAMTIGLVLLGGVVLLVSNSSATQREIEGVGRQIENGRYALSVLRDDIPHAGFYGEYHDLGQPGSMPDACSTSVNEIEAALGMPIQGFNDVSGNPSLSCLSDAEHVDGTDILVLRRAATSATPIDALVQEELYVQSVPTDKVVAQATGGESDASRGSFELNDLNLNPAPIRKLRTRIYFVGPDADGVPTLKRKMLVAQDGSLQWREQAVASGIEQFQIEYGVDSDANGTVQDYENAPSGTAEWADVIALRVYLIARNHEPTPGYTNTTTYNLGDTNADGYTYDDGYRRHALVSAIRAENPSLRRQ